MHKNDVNELLEHAQQQILTIKKDPVVSKVIVKNILENLRSALEYCAQYINREKLMQDKRIYFPYGKTENHFKESLRKNNFTRLVKDFPLIYSNIERLQPFSCGSDWLTVMCEATNEAKHNRSLDISSDTKIEKNLTVLDIPGFSFSAKNNSFNHINITMMGCSFNGKTIDDFQTANGNVNILKSGEIPIKYSFEILENKTFVLNDYKWDLIELLDKSFLEISNFSKDLFE